MSVVKFAIEDDQIVTSNDEDSDGSRSSSQPRDSSSNSMQS